LDERFLAEDAGKDLDLVLDSVLRAFAHRRAVVSSMPLLFVRRAADAS
jgi:hypothetical protein